MEIENTQRMRRKKLSVQSNYEIQALLGEGLTSRVYKAIRQDTKYGAQQVVALKVLRSKKHVSVFRNEFARMQEIQSSRCVRIFAWESLPEGPALVMEYVSGKTLYELSTSATLSLEEVQFIISEVSLALGDLLEVGVFHGDLNLKNIFITESGAIKLVDFGFCNEKEDYLGTPEFLSPERWAGDSPSYEGDLYSLGIIERKLLGYELPNFISEKQWFEVLKSIIDSSELLSSDPAKRTSAISFNCRNCSYNLAQKVNSLNVSDSSITNVFEFKAKQKRVSTYLIKSISLLCLSILIVFSAVEPIGAHSLGVFAATSDWYSYRINNGPWHSSPSEVFLPPGRYRMQHKSWEEESISEILVGGKSRILLNDEFFKTKKE